MRSAHERSIACHVALSELNASRHYLHAPVAPSPCTFAKCVSRSIGPAITQVHASLSPVRLRAIVAASPAPAMETTPTPAARVPSARQSIERLLGGMPVQLDYSLAQSKAVWRGLRRFCQRLCVTNHSSAMRELTEKRDHYCPSYQTVIRFARSFALGSTFSTFDDVPCDISPAAYLLEPGPDCIPGGDSPRGLAAGAPSLVVSSGPVGPCGWLCGLIGVIILVSIVSFATRGRSESAVCKNSYDRHNDCDSGPGVFGGCGPPLGRNGHGTSLSVG